MTNENVPSSSDGGQETTKGSMAGLQEPFGKVYSDLDTIVTDLGNFDQGTPPYFVALGALSAWVGCHPNDTRARKELDREAPIAAEIASERKLSVA